MRTPQAARKAKAPVLSPAAQLHKAVESHFGVVFSKTAAPAGLHGRETMLANGAQAKADAKQGTGKQMMLAMRENNKLRHTQANAAGQLKNFAQTLLTEENYNRVRDAANELKELERHFG